MSYICSIQKLIELFGNTLKIIGSLPSIQYIQIDDNSDGFCDGGAKLVITVVSESFIDATVIQRHRKIQAILKDEHLMPSIHALTLNTWTPTQYEAKKSIPSSS